MRRAKPPTRKESEPMTEKTQASSKPVQEEAEWPKAKKIVTD
jgi:hypothetical protein